MANVDGCVVLDAALRARGFGGKIEITDSSATPVTSYAYTKVSVSTDREPLGSTGLPPEVNASIRDNLGRPFAIADKGKPIAALV